MPNIASDSFYADTLPSTDNAARFTVDVAKKGHANIRAVNTSNTACAYWSGYIKRAISGKLWRFANNMKLLPGQSAIEKGINLSASDEIHAWGDGNIDLLIDGGIEG